MRFESEVSVLRSQPPWVFSLIYGPVEQYLPSPDALGIPELAGSPACDGEGASVSGPAGRQPDPADPSDSGR